MSRARPSGRNAPIVVRQEQVASPDKAISTALSRYRTAVANADGVTALSLKRYLTTAAMQQIKKGAKHNG